MSYCLLRIFQIFVIQVGGKEARPLREVYIAKLKSRYAVILEGDSISFDKAFSPVDLLQPDSFEVVVQQIMDKKVEDDDLPPF